MRIASSAACTSAIEPVSVMVLLLLPVAEVSPAVVPSRKAPSVALLASAVRFESLYSCTVTVTSRPKLSASAITKPRFDSASGVSSVTVITVAPPSVGTSLTLDTVSAVKALARLLVALIRVPSSLVVADAPPLAPVASTPPAV